MSFGQLVSALASFVSGPSGSLRSRRLLTGGEGARQTRRSHVNAIKENAMTNETNKQRCCDQQHLSHSEWMIDSSDPRNARFREPLTNLDADFWESWSVEDVAGAMAAFAFDTLDSLHANDPNFDREMARDQCTLAARRAVFDYAGMLTEADHQQMAVRMRPGDKARAS
jgi:hypothetical protein